MKTAVLVLIGAVALTASAGFWWFRPVEERSLATTRAAEQNEKTPREVPVMPLFARTSPTAGQAPAADQTPSPRLEPMPEEEPPSVEEARVLLENQFDSERGRSALRRLEGVVKDATSRIALPGAKLDAVECRDSVCRMDLTFDDADVDNRFFHGFSHLDDRSADTEYLQGFEINIMDRTVVDGRVRARAYLKRPIER